MIRLSTKRLRAGMIVAQSVYNRKGASFLTKGTVLNAHYIDQLKQIGISQVCVTSSDPNIRLLPQNDIVQDETRQAAVNRLFDFYEKVQNNGSINVEPLQDISEKIIVDLVTQPDSLVQMTDLRLFDDYTFSHSVNVAALSAMVGIAMKFSQDELTDLTLGALLHDIGKLNVPLSVLNKPSSLNDNEFAIIKNHPVAGYERLFNMLSLRDLNVRVLAAIARQHHEHMDGHGYPDQLKGGQIHKYAQIVAVADVYDALTSSRTYKKAYPPHVAYKIMTKCSGKQFNTSILDVFFDHVAVYPVGCVLKTSWGLAIVKKVRVGLTRYPIVVVFADMEGKMLETRVEVDTLDHTPDFIQSVMDDMELFTLIRRIGTDPTSFIL